MTIVPQLIPVAYSLSAVVLWGLADFLGGYAARRGNAFVLTTFAHASGLLLVGGIAGRQHAPWPSNYALQWSVAAGLCGGAALAIFYRSLASGKMGLTAPVAAVLGAGIPTAFGIATQGFPGAGRIAGFLLAGLGIWLISRAEDSARPEGVGMAALAGVGFAGFFLCASQTGDASALWVAAVSRTASFALTAVIVLAAKDRHFSRNVLGWAVMAGCLDTLGSVLYVRASQSGRLDAAVVLSSLYPGITALLARFILKEHLTRWRALGMLAALVAVPLIAAR
jgi:drug/metabolite transporter (DMT)-like permease